MWRAAGLPIARFHSQAGAFAHMSYNRDPVPPPAELSRLRVVLVAPRNPLNIGAAARAMSNFGFQSLRLVNPYAPSFREARSAVGASEILANAERYKSVAEAVGDCTLVVGTTAVRNRDLQHPVRRPEYGTRLIHRRLTGWPGPDCYHRTVELDRGIKQD